MLGFCLWEYLYGSMHMDLERGVLGISIYWFNAKGLRTWGSG